MSEGRTPTRRERERDRHRTEILEAALRVARSRGLGGVTIEEVAREAEFAVGSIYRHFRSKDEMVELLVVHSSEPIAEAVRAVVASPRPFEEQLGAFVEALEESFEERLPLLQMFLSAGAFPLPGTAAGDRLAAARTAYIEAAEQLVRNGQEEGVLPPGEPRTMALALVGMVSGLLRWRSYGFSTPERPADVVPRAFLDGFRRRVDRE